MCSYIVLSTAKKKEQKRLYWYHCKLDKVHLDRADKECFQKPQKSMITAIYFVSIPTSQNRVQIQLVWRIINYGIYISDLSSDITVALFWDCIQLQWRQLPNALNLIENLMDAPRSSFKSNQSIDLSLCTMHNIETDFIFMHLTHPNTEKKDHS